MAEITDIKEYVTGFISAYVGLIVAVSFLNPIMQTVANVSGNPVLTATIVGSLVGAGILMFIMKAFF